jgi:hypothetical protein
MGEFTYTGFDHRFDLSVSSVRLPVDPGDVATINFPASKTDPFRKGVTVIIPFAPPHIYPVRALTRLISRAESRGDAQNLGLPRCLTRRSPIPVTTPPSTSTIPYAGGAAAWAASIGINANDIKTLGRCDSDCFRFYVDARSPTHARAGRTLLNTDASDSSLLLSGLPSRPGLETCHGWALALT